MPNQRQSNIELLRILCMLFIIVLHIILAHQSVLGNDETISIIFKSFTIVSVNSFVLISGYFGLNFKTERLIRLIVQTFFYSVVLLLVSVLIGWHTLDIKRDVFAFSPILTKQYWFITCYIVLYIISPWLNLSIQNFDKRTYKQILLIGFLIIYVWPTISYLLNTRQFIGDEGYGIVNFTYLYILGRYLRIYYSQNHSSTFYFGGYVLSALTLSIILLFLLWFLGVDLSNWFSFNTIFVFAGAVFLFLTFNKISIQSNVINFWAKPCLAVYLIHLNPYIWQGFCDTIGVRNFHGFQYILLLLFLPILVYMICSIIELCRQKVMNGIENKIISFFTTK